MVGNSRGYSGEPYDNTDETRFLKFINNDVIVYQDVLLKTLSNVNLADITQP